MGEKRDQFIGLRLSKSEKSYIQSYAQLKELSVAEFLREAAASYIKDIESRIKKIDPIKVALKLRAIKKSFSFILSDLDDIEFEVTEDYKLEELNTNDIRDLQTEIDLELEE